MRILVILALLLAVASAQSCVDCEDYVSKPNCTRPDLCGKKPACRECAVGQVKPQCPAVDVCISAGCFNCRDGMVTKNCSRPDRCGFQPACMMCMKAMPMPQCPDYTLCAGCVDCKDGVVTKDCPNPGTCGWKPACTNCMSGMPMPQCPNTTLCPGCVDCVDGDVVPSCPNPAICGGQPACQGCMAGMPMPKCPDPDICTAMGANCVMNMYFGASQNVCVLLKGWNVTNGWQYFGTVLAIIAFCFFREWVTAYRMKRHLDSGKSSRDAVQSDSYNAMKSKEEEAELIALGKYTAKEQVYDSLWYLLNLTTAYLLMLIFMTYNVGLCITVLLGCFAGHFIFVYHYKKKHAASLKPADADHCCAE